jgi:hypothetical protein
MIKLVLALDSRVADNTFTRLLDGMQLTADQESNARQLIIAAQNAARALTPPMRVARLRLGPIPNLVAMASAGAAEILALVSNDADRATLLSRIVIIH